MSRLAAAAGATTVPSTTAMKAAAPGAAVEEDESVLTVAEKGLKRVYDLLREQADALRAAKQAELQAKVAAAKAAAAAGGGSPTGGAATAGKKATAAGPMRPTVSGASRPVKRPTMAGGGGGGGGMMGGGGDGLAGHYRPRPSTAVAAFNDDDGDAGSVGSSQSGASSGGQRKRPRASGSGGGGGGGSLPKRPSAAASVASKSKKQKEAEFSIPKRERAPAPVPANDDGFAIPKRSSSSIGGGMLGPMAADPYFPHGLGLPPPPQMPPPPPPPEEEQQEDGPFPFVAGLSLDRSRFDPEYLLWGMGQQDQQQQQEAAGGDGGRLRGWESREADRPLVVPLPDFGLQPDRRKVLAIRASVPPDARRFALNLCPGPLEVLEAGGDADAAPSEVLAHFNPRRIYKGGSIVHNSRRDGQWVEKGTPAVALTGLPPVFGVTLTLILTVDKDLISLCMEDAAGQMLPACEILLNVDGSNRGAALAKLTELALHLPVKEETVGFQEEWVVHEVWWSPSPPPPPPPSSAAPAAQQAPAMAPTPAVPAMAAMAAMAAAAEVAAGLAVKGPIRPQVRSFNNLPQLHGAGGVMDGPQSMGAGMAGEGPWGPLPPPTDTVDMEAATGRMEEKLSRLGGLLGSTGSGGGGGGGFAAGLAALGAGGVGMGGGGQMAVVAVSNLPEPGTVDEAEAIKGDLRGLFGQVGGGVQEVHLKPGAATAFVVLADPRDLAEAIRAVDWHEYGGRKLRVARSSKRVF